MCHLVCRVTSTLKCYSHDWIPGQNFILLIPCPIIPWGLWGTILQSFSLASLASILEYCLQVCVTPRPTRNIWAFSYWHILSHNGSSRSLSKPSQNRSYESSQQPEQIEIFLSLSYSGITVSKNINEIFFYLIKLTGPSLTSE